MRAARWALAGVLLALSVPAAAKIHVPWREIAPLKIPRTLVGQGVIRKNGRKIVVTRWRWKVPGKSVDEAPPDSIRQSGRITTHRKYTPGGDHLLVEQTSLVTLPPHLREERARNAWSNLESNLDLISKRFVKPIGEVALLRAAVAGAIASRRTSSMSDVEAIGHVLEAVRSRAKKPPVANKTSNPFADIDPVKVAPDLSTPRTLIGWERTISPNGRRSSIAIKWRWEKPKKGSDPPAGQIKQRSNRRRSNWISRVYSYEKDRVVIEQVTSLDDSAPKKTPAAQQEAMRLEAIVDQTKGVSKQRVLLGAQAGMLARLDRHSLLLPLPQASSSNRTLDGYAGVGVNLVAVDEGIKVTACWPGTPAYKAGIRKGDLIHKAGKAPVGASLETTIEHLLGEEGTRVDIKIKRDGRTRKVRVMRETIDTSQMLGRVVGDGIGHITFHKFTKGTAKKLAKAIKDLGRIKGLVLDLRGNPGGDMKEAGAVADLFIKKGKFAIARDRDGKVVKELFASSKTPHAKLPLVVLIDSDSASASEIVSGVMQDTKRAKIVGERSYGKGSVQDIFPAFDGSTLMLTVARYETVGGQRPDGVGIKPDVVIKPVTSSKTKRPSRKVEGSEDHVLSEAMKLLGLPR